MTTTQQHILSQPISSTTLSHTFKAVAETLGFHTLADLLLHRTNHLAILPGFDQSLIYEYVEYLEINKLAHLIDP